MMRARAARTIGMRDVRLECDTQIAVVVKPLNYPPDLPIAVEQEKRDMGNAMPVGQPAALVRSNIGDSNLQFAGGKMAASLDRLLAQSATRRTLRIVNPYDDRNAGERVHATDRISFNSIIGSADPRNMLSL